MYFPSCLYFLWFYSVIAWKALWNCWKFSRKRSSGEQKSHNFWSEGSVAEQSWSLSWSTPSFSCLAGCEFGFFFPLCFLTHRAFGEVWRETRSEGTDQPLKLCFNVMKSKFFLKKYVLNWAEGAGAATQNIPHSDTSLGKVSCDPWVGGCAEKRE